jgi:hypothetical protein
MLRGEQTAGLVFRWSGCFEGLVVFALTRVGVGHMLRRFGHMRRRWAAKANTRKVGRCLWEDLRGLIHILHAHVTAAPSIRSGVGKSRV